MSPSDAAKLFRDKADVYLELAGLVRDDQQRRLSHDLFEEDEARAEFLERMFRSKDGFDAFRSRRRLN